MGFYLNPTDGRNTSKAQWLIDDFGAIEINLDGAFDILTSPNTTMGVVCVVDNGAFDAAAFCFDMGEFRDFTAISDNRHKTWLAMDRKTIESISGYRPIPGR